MYTYADLQQVGFMAAIFGFLAGVIIMVVIIRWSQKSRSSDQPEVPFYPGEVAPRNLDGMTYLSGQKTFVGESMRLEGWYKTYRQGWVIHVLIPEKGDYILGYDTISDPANEAE